MTDEMSERHSQAQIDAAFDTALRYTGPVGCSPAITRELIKNVLAAAAEVGPQIVATLTPGMLALIEKDRAATIERCAQRIYEYMIEAGLRGWANDAAAEIRALKIGERQQDI